MMAIIVCLVMVGGGNRRVYDGAGNRRVYGDGRWRSSSDIYIVMAIAILKTMSTVIVVVCMATGDGIIV